MKERTHYLKLAPLILGIFTFPFSKVIHLSYPNFFSGKFNYFETISILPAEFLILAGSLLILITNFKTEIKAQLTLPIIFFTLLTLISLNPSYLIATIFLTALSKLDHKETKILKQTFFIVVSIQAALAVIQFIIQSPNGTKGIAKIRIKDTEILRSYGTFLHPNILAAALGITILSLKTRFKYLLIPALIAPFSMAASLATFMASLFKKQKLLSLLLLLPLLTIFAVRYLDNTHETVTERINQTEQILNHDFTLKEILIGQTTLKTPEIKQDPWTIQPVHNTYLFTLQNFGLIALVILIAMLTQLIKLNPPLGIFLATIMLFDHFSLSLGQGIIILTIMLNLKPCHSS